MTKKCNTEKGCTTCVWLRPLMMSGRALCLEYKFSAIPVDDLPDRCELHCTYGDVMGRDVDKTLSA